MMMKALIRNEGETITENTGIAGIDWKTGMPLTSPAWAGGPYILVNDYVPDDDPADDFGPTPERRKAKGAVQAPPAQAPAAKETVNPEASVPVGDTIVIDGVTYTRTS